MESMKIKFLFDKRNHKFEIPNYQRAYSWEAEHIRQFMDDLKNVKDNYFLGHFLFESTDKSVSLVIDGQQRLATCVIFFSAIKNEVKKRAEQGGKTNIDLDDLEDYYLRDLRKKTQKFFMVGYDNNFFRDEIIEGKTNSQELDTFSKKRIRSAKEYFEKELAKASTEEIEKWHGLLENADITTYEVNDKIKATQVFAFQNDRGAKLTKLEVLKAYFMLQIYLSGESKEKIEQDIGYIEKDFSRIYNSLVRVTLGEDDVLNYYWRAFGGKGYYSEETVREVKEKVSSTSLEKMEWIKNFVSGLAKAFQSVEKFESDTRRAALDLRCLNRLAVAYPFIIKALHFCDTSSDAFSRLLRLLENITFRSQLRGGRAEIESRMNPYLARLPQNEL